MLAFLNVSNSAICVLTYLVPGTPKKKDVKYSESQSHMNWNVYKSDKYYQIHLDKFKWKTIYKDDMIIPSYPLAVAIAEEWASQPSKSMFNLV